MGVNSQRHAPAALYPREKTPGTHWIGGWVGPRAGLDAGAGRQSLCPCRGSNLDRPAHSQTLYRLTYRGSTSCILLNIRPINEFITWKGTYEIKCMDSDEIFYIT
jgi:hypothetical protein